MIDTVVLTLYQDNFRILDHNKFSPNTENLFVPPYIKVTGKSFFKAVNNATKETKQNYGYMPNLTLFKAVRSGGFSIFLNIQFSIPKILYGNNFDEVEDSDFGEICWRLKNKLLQMGIVVDNIRSISEAQVSAIHYSKNIVLTDFSIPYSYMKEISKANISLVYDTNQSDFRNEGHSVKYRTNSFEVIFYDKKADLNKAKQSEKRSIEKDDYCQFGLFDKITSKKPLEVLRMEVRIGNRKKMQQILSKHNFQDKRRNFNDLYCKDISKTILESVWDNIERSYPNVLRTNSESLIDFAINIKLNNPSLKPKNIIEYVGAYSLIRENGIREFRKLFTNSNPTTWYRMNKEIQGLKIVSNKDYFAVIRKTLSEFNRTKIESYIDNNVI